MTSFNEKEFLIGTADYDTHFWNAMRGSDFAITKIHGGTDTATGGFTLPSSSDEKLAKAVKKESIFRNLATVVKAYDAIADEILRLRDMRKQSEVDSVLRDDQMKRIKDLQDFIKKQSTDITEFDEALVSRHIAKITVFEDHFIVDFKSGITIDIEA